MFVSHFTQQEILLQEHFLISQGALHFSDYCRKSQATDSPLLHFPEPRANRTTLGCFLSLKKRNPSSEQKVSDYQWAAITNRMNGNNDKKTEDEEEREEAVDSPES